MDDSTVANADQRHHFSFASEVYDLYRNHDGAVDFNPDIPDTYDRISPKEEQVCIPYYDIDTKWRCVAIGNPLQLLSRHERLSSDDLQFGKKIDLESKSVPSIYKIEVFPTDKGNSVDDYDPDRLQNRNHAINIPEEPFLLFLSHFETCVPFGHVSDLIERTFELFPEISYEFVAEECLVSNLHMSFLHIVSNTNIFFLTEPNLNQFSLLVECCLFERIVALQNANKCVHSRLKLYCRGKPPVGKGYFMLPQYHDTEIVSLYSMN